MSPAVQRYEVSQIFAEAKARGVDLKFACLLVAQWFDMHSITPPASLLDWLAEVPQDQWHPERLH